MKGIDVSVHNGNIDWGKVKLTASISSLSVPATADLKSRRMRSLSRTTQGQKLSVFLSVRTGTAML